MNSPIVDLAKRMAISPETRHVLALLKTGPEIERALSTVVAGVGRVEQRVLVTVVAFRMLGSMTPCEITLMEHMPPLRGLPEKDIMDAFQNLVDSDVLQLAAPSEQYPAGALYWPAVERLVQDALKYYEAPAIVGIDGIALR